MAKTYTNRDLLKMLNKRISETTAREVAAILGIAEPTLSKIVHGKRPVTPQIASWLLQRDVQPERVFRVA